VSLAVETIIKAINDELCPNTAGTTTSSVLTNDSLNGVPVDLSAITISSIGTMPTGITLNNDGTVTIADDVISGTYNFNYSICELSDERHVGNTVTSMLSADHFNNASNDNLGPSTAGTTHK